jgi:hypothetical protein
MTTVSLDIHDSSVLRTNYDLLLELKEHYPGLKVTLFHIPYDYETEMGQLALMRDEKLKTLKRMLGWVELVPHGLIHLPNEFEKCDRHTMKMVLDAYKEAFGRDKLPYKHGFCAPYWLWNQEVVDVLNEKGWWGAVDRNQPDMLKTNKYYVYTHSIEEQFWESNYDTLKLHGHMTAPSSNNLEDCFLNLMKMPHDAEFKFASEMVQND